MGHGLTADEWVQRGLGVADGQGFTIACMTGFSAPRCWKSVAAHTEVSKLNRPCWDPSHHGTFRTLHTSILAAPPSHQEPSFGTDHNPAVPLPSYSSSHPLQKKKQPASGRLDALDAQHKAVTTQLLGMQEALNKLEDHVARVRKATDDMARPNRTTQQAAAQRVQSGQSVQQKTTQGGMRPGFLLSSGTSSTAPTAQAPAASSTSVQQSQASSATQVADSSGAERQKQEAAERKRVEQEAKRKEYEAAKAARAEERKRADEERWAREAEQRRWVTAGGCVHELFWATFFDVGRGCVLLWVACAGMQAVKGSCHLQQRASTCWAVRQHAVLVNTQPLL